MQQGDELYLESIVAIREKNYQEAEDKLRGLLGGNGKNKKAEIILSCLLIRRECQKLLTVFEESK
ncbi:MAG: hypothetical protein MUO85_05170 [candidate division Zixibacteria bacterium]|nr:hypothetical protein [candidate division Zixibacteria bacterium]